MPTFTNATKEWLTEKVLAHMKGKKRFAFKSKIDGESVGIVAERGKGTTVTFELYPTEDSTVMYKDKPVELNEAPPELASIQQIEDTAPEPEAPVVERPEGPEPEPESNVTPLRPDVTPMEEEPAAPPEPAKPTKRRGRGSSKPRAVFREIILDKILASLHMTRDMIPPPEVMFAKQIKLGHKLVPITKLAAANNPEIWEHITAEAAKAIREVLPEFGACNILNPSAEVETNRVITVMTRLLNHKRMISSIEACKVVGEIPDRILRHRENFDRSILQLSTGRHRAIALALIYGPEVSIPVITYESDFHEAMIDCMESNSCRTQKKMELIHLEGLLSERDENATQARFRECRGRGKDLASMITYHIQSSPDDLFTELAVPIITKKGSVAGLSMPSLNNVLTEAINAIGADEFTELDENSVAWINAIITTLNLLFNNIKRQEETLASNAWNSYASGSMGRLIGQAMKKAKQDKEPYDPDEIAAAISRTVVGFIQMVSKHPNPEIQKCYVRTPVVEHVAMLRKYAADNDIVLPIIDRSFITKQ